jgi:hypothetical protein
MRPARRVQAHCVPMRWKREGAKMGKTAPEWG